MSREFIQSFMRRSREAYLENGARPSSVEETFDAVADTATKQVIRGMIEDGFISEDRAKSRNTARRVNLDGINKSDIPKCPPGYVFDRKRMDCIPRTNNDRIDARAAEDQLLAPQFNVWGRTGLNGDGYAYEDAPGLDANATHWDASVHEGMAKSCPDCRKPSKECICTGKHGLNKTRSVYEGEINSRKSFCFECMNPQEECSCGCEDKPKKKRRPRR